MHRALSKPVNKMHPMRPLKSLFHPAIIISIACQVLRVCDWSDALYTCLFQRVPWREMQAVIHLYAMITAVNMAKEAMGEELLQEVIDFHRKNDRGTVVGLYGWHLAYDLMCAVRR